MLSDVFVPFLTYPDATNAAFARSLQDFISRFASAASFSAAEIDLPNMADRWGASLIALPQMVANIEASSRQAARDLVGHTGADIGDLVVTRESFRAVLGQVAAAFVSRARYHDLTIVGIAAGSSEKTDLAEQLLFGTGRPIMAVPEVDLADFDMRNIAIAWDGGLHAGRAVFDAMPLLKNARSVAVFGVAADGATDHLTRIQSYLERHDVASKTVALTGPEPDIGGRLQQEAIAIGAGCMVMGGYGHNRFREFVLGGVTKTVLNAPLLPVLLSH